MALRPRVEKLLKAARGKSDFFQLADGSWHYFDAEEAAKETFGFFTDSMVADYKRKPRPQPPELLRTIAHAADRGEALTRVMGGYGHLPLDSEALVERAELVPRPLTVGQDVDEPVTDLSE